MDKIGKALGGLGISTNTKLAIMQLVKGDLTAFGGYLKGLARFGQGIAVLGAGVALYQYSINPTTANLLNFVISTASIIFSPAASLALGFLDATGVSGKVYNYVGNIIDNQVGYSVGKAFFNNFQYTYNHIQTQLAKP